MQVGRCLSLLAILKPSEPWRRLAVGTSMSEQTLNEHHRRRLLVSCEYVDRLLADIESVMSADASLSPFPKYILDLTAEEKQRTSEAVATLRAQLVALLKARHVAVAAPGISSRRSLLTCLGYIDITVEELKPRYLRGYGPVPQALIVELNRSVEEVQATVRQAISTLKKAVKSGKDQAPSAGAR